MKNKEITNLVLIPNEFEGMPILEEVFETIKSHSGFLFMNRSNSVMSPQGPTGYLEIVEIHWKNLESLMEWSNSLKELFPEDQSKVLNGVQILFYDYK